MRFLARSLRLAAASRTDTVWPLGVSLIETVILDVRAYGLSSAVSALLRDLRD